MTVLKKNIVEEVIGVRRRPFGSPDSCHEVSEHFSIHCERTLTLNQFLGKINLITDPKLIPTNVHIDYQILKDSTLSIKNLVSVIELTVQLAYEKFNLAQPGPLVLTAYTSEVISKGDANLLKLAGFKGIGGIGYTKDFVINGRQAIYNGEDWWNITNVIADLNSNLSTLNKYNKVDFTIPITLRQSQVLDLIVNRGLGNKMIAKTLNISESAVKLHIKLLLTKFNVNNRTELAIVARDLADQIIQK